MPFNLNVRGSFYPATWMSQWLSIPEVREYGVGFKLMRALGQYEFEGKFALGINDKYQRENAALDKRAQEAEGETSIVKGIGINSPEMKQANATIAELRQRISELMSISKSHQDLMGKQIVDNQELRKDNKALAKQIDDYFNARLNNVRKSGV